MPADVYLNRLKINTNLPHACCFLALAPAKGQARNMLGGGNAFAVVEGHNRPRPAAAVEPEERVVITGKGTNPAGGLPGAVVILAARRQVAVTNADGDFEFVVPASAGPLLARVAYAGYADELVALSAGAAESTVNLVNAAVIVVTRKQQLKTHLKTARKQVRRSLKQARS